MATPSPKSARDYELDESELEAGLRAFATLKPDLAPAKHVLTNSNDPNIRKVYELGYRVHKQAEEADILGVDFTSLKIVPNSSWMFTLNHKGMVDANKMPIKPEAAAKNPGSQHLFTLDCYERIGGRDTPRFTRQVYGQPSSAEVLDFLKRSILFVRPRLPNRASFTVEFAPHMPVLRPFLDSLPRPVSYHFETPPLAEEFYKQSVAVADELKKKGNVAFAARDGAAALTAYMDAADHLCTALDKTPNANQDAAAKRLLVICYANCAAVYLLDGKGMDAALALGQEAEKADPTYAKGYHRQARSHELLGQIEEARQVLERALARQDVHDRESLVAALKALPDAAKNT
ncbi:hypothetical protein FA95DRAFT_1606143 [Auriscalpium vulgare]|uniref:Uncharacterized protein n=1 Tax=Auriscalpium vulgare TaxID=40419 RepID=A0ACB8RU06_9AGAM|nr:hypothetical protein FA95DRAFT_1606143 [Auriscalpium vulgare]